MDNAYHSLFHTHTNGNYSYDNEIVEMIVEKRNKTSIRRAPSGGG